MSEGELEAAAPRRGWTWGPGGRVLVVDDNATNRRILVKIPRALGHDRGRERLPARRLGWAAWRTDWFDIAILDMHMPEMDGIQLARQIRAPDAGSRRRS